MPKLAKCPTFFPSSAMTQGLPSNDRQESAGNAGVLLSIVIGSIAIPPSLPCEGWPDKGAQACLVLSNKAAACGTGDLFIRSLATLAGNLFIVCNRGMAKANSLLATLCELVACMVCDGVFIDII